MIRRIALTPGEPAGIGPDLAVIAAQQSRDDELVAFADPKVLLSRATALGLPIKLKEINLNDAPQILSQNELGVVRVDTRVGVTPGKLDPQNAHYVLETLERATIACQKAECHALVTGPVQKSTINDAGIAFSGHTEWLADKTGQDKVVMMLATEGLKVALATTHLPLKEVADAITFSTITQVVKILYQDLQTKFGLPQPNILVCGLNPHAGESGHLGREEIDIIEPALAALRAEGIDCRGPLPADTLFTPKHLAHADAVLAMYHDQGLPVLKYKGFGQAANITLGLPIIRTSVDHGTALDLAATGNVDAGSLHTAINYALLMAKSSHAKIR